MKRNRLINDGGEKSSPPPAEAGTTYPRGQWVYQEYDPVCSTTSGCIWAGFIIFFVIILAMFLVFWLVPYPYYPPPPPLVKVYTTSEGGQAIPGLGRDLLESPDACGPGEFYNKTRCQLKVVYPLVVEGTIINYTVNPCESFYDHACGMWNEYNARVRLPTAPGGKLDRSFGHVNKMNRHWFHRVLHDPPRGSEAKLRSFFQSCMSTLVHPSSASMEQTRGYRNYMMQRIRSPLHTLEDLPQALAQLMAVAFTTPISVSVSEHPYKLGRVIYFGTDGWTDLNATTVYAVFSSMYNAEQSTQKTQQFLALNNMIERQRAKIRTISTLQQYVEYLLKAGNDDFVHVQDIIRLAGESWVDALTAQGFPARLFVNRTSDAWVRDYDFYKWFFTRLNADIESWKVYVEFSILYHTSFDYFPVLPQSVTLRRHPAPKTEQTVSWKKRSIGVSEAQCMSLTEQMLPGLVSQLYQVDNETTSVVMDIAESIKSYMLRHIQNKTSDKVRAFIVDKLEHLKIRVGGANHIWTPETFPIASDRYMQNLDYIRRDRVQREWNAPSDRRDDAQRFGAPLTLVNAMYSPTSNTISVFDGILQYPFVHKRFSATSLYGAIGTVIAHEMSHALGPLGRLFDAQGLFKPWHAWDTHANDAYLHRVQCVADEWKHHHQCPTTGPRAGGGDDYGHHTLEEDVADLLGVKTAFGALLEKTTENEHEFFYAFAQMWCSVSTPATTCHKIQHDVHALPQIRVDTTLKHMTEFREIFACPLRTRKVCEVF